MDATADSGRNDAGPPREPDAEQETKRHETDEALNAERGEPRDDRITGRGALQQSTTEALDRERRHEDAILRVERAAAEERTRLLAEAETARARAEAATRMRDEVLAIVSHDLKNPLGAILMNAERLALKDASDVEAPHHRALVSIHRSAARALRIVDDLLDVASLDSGDAALENRPEPVANLVAEALDAFRLQAVQRSVHLDSSVAANAQREILCDAGRIEQVLSNLIANALKFTPEGGAVHVRVEALGESAVFAVSDTGPGIPESQREKVFQRFWRATGGDHPGRGLGLYIARKLIAAHGGRIWADARPGGGSTFSFTVAFATDSGRTRRAA